MKPSRSSVICLLWLITVSARAFNPDPEVSLVIDKDAAVSVTYAIEKLTAALRQKNIGFEKVFSTRKAKGKWLIVAGLSGGDGAAAELLKDGNRSLPQVPEALAVWKSESRGKPAWVMCGYDDRGLMYALLDVAQRIAWSDDPGAPMQEVREVTEKPDVPERAVSVFTMNRAYWESRFYDEAYWSRYLDMLAQNRFNSLVVIFGYENGGFLAPPYPYFFDVEKFPDVRMVGITTEQQQRNLDALNRLIAMAHERGVRVTVGIWDHIYRGGVQGGGIPGTKEAPATPVPGLVWGVNGENLIAYNKAALAKFVKLVPDLDRIQFRMHNESGLEAGEQHAFWTDVFRMMRETAPALRVDLRAKELPESVIESALEAGLNFRITTKYWMEQMGMPYHPTKTNPEPSPIRHSYAYLLRYPKKYAIHWRLWNGGTSRVLLWGDPEYVRRFAASTHLYDGEGYEVNEPLATKMEAQPHDAAPFELLNKPYRYYDFEFERYWHFFQVFGRVGYNPQTPEDVWKREFEKRFGRAAPFVEEALHRASWVLPRIIASVYPYRGFPMTRGWAEKQRLGNLDAYARNEGSDILQFANFEEEAAIRLRGGETAKILPSANSQWFLRRSEEIDGLIAQAEEAAGKAGRSKEFNSTITDLKILSNLARYHGRRIPAAISYRLFERTQDASRLEEAIAHEKKAIAAWRKLVTAAGDVYAENLMMGVSVAALDGHWRDELALLEKGLAALEEQHKRLLLHNRPVSAVGYQLSPSAPDRHNPLAIEHEPVREVALGEPITIAAKVTAPAGVKWVKLRYRPVNQDLDYQTLLMLPREERDVYQATVPAEHVSSVHDFMYFIEAMDNRQRGQIYPDLNRETPYRFVRIIR